MSVVIKIENVSKQYRLGLIGTNTLKGDLQRWWKLIKGESIKAKGESEEGIEKHE